MISTKQLAYALAVQRHLHFKKAAEHCHITQSALSTSLAELEKQLGFQLFERDNKKVLVTPIGEEVLRRAGDIMQRLEELERLADTLKSPLTYPISIGMIPTIAPYLLPKVFPELKRQYPDCQPVVVEEQTHVLLDMVRGGELDTAIIALPYACEGLLTFEFWAEDFYWVALKEDDLSSRDQITSKELASTNLMLLKDGHCLKEHILDVCKLPEPQTNHGFGTASLNTLIQMVLNGMGTTLIPQMAIKQLTSQYPQLSTVHLNETGPHRKIAFVIRPNYTRMNSIEALLQVCRETLEKLRQ
jgi:LysR family hydrogen peroxide-inducible transcriptional activator